MFLRRVLLVQIYKTHEHESILSHLLYDFPLLIENMEKIQATPVAVRRPKTKVMPTWAWRGKGRNNAPAAWPAAPSRRWPGGGIEEIGHLEIGAALLEDAIGLARIEDRSYLPAGMMPRSSE